MEPFHTHLGQEFMSDIEGPFWLITDYSQDSAEGDHTKAQQNTYSYNAGQIKAVSLILVLVVATVFTLGVTDVISLAFAQTENTEPIDLADLSLMAGVGGPLAYSDDVLPDRANVTEGSLLLPPDDYFSNEGFSTTEIEINTRRGTTRSRGETVEHLVAPGETLSQIAESYGLKVDTIKANNPELSQSKYLRAGQKLSIPYTDGVTHKVVSGDTLSGIADRYEVKIADILAENGLSNNTLSVGQQLFVPGAKYIAAPTTIAVATTSSSSVKADRTWTAGQDIGLGFTAPLTAVFTQGFGHTSFSAESGFYGASGHTGLDWGAKKGTPIYAAQSGVVAFSGQMRGYGNIVIIKHPNGMTTRYGHNTTNLVSKGQSVSQGQQIATVGSTGRSTGNHLHFEVREKDGSHSLRFYKPYIGLD